MDLSDKIVSKTTILQQFIGYKGQLHHLPLEGEIKNKMMYEGEECVVWCVNDYIGLMNNQAAKEAATEVTQKYGPSYPHSVRLTIGHTEKHDELERQLTEMLPYEDSMLVNLGYQGFFSIIDALVDRHDTIIYDQKCHACLIDGIRLHQGKKFSFRHNDMAHFEERLEHASKHNKNGVILVIVDGLYSMNGTLAPLDKIVELKVKYPFSLFVDDSHAFGVFGENGMGSPSHFGVESEVDIYVSTFTKAFGNLGGFVSAKKELVDYLRFAVRSQIFSRSMPLPMVVSVIENIKTFLKEPERRTRLFSNIRRFKEGLNRLGIHFGESDGPIVPLHISGTLQDGLDIYFALREKGIFSYIVTYPVVERGTSMIRMVCTYNHTEEDIDYTLHVLGEISKAKPAHFRQKMLATS